MCPPQLANVRGCLDDINKLPLKPVMNRGDPIPLKGLPEGAREVFVRCLSVVYLQGTEQMGRTLQRTAISAAISTNMQDTAVHRDPLPRAYP